MNIQNGFGTTLTQMIIQQTREYLDEITRSASQSSDGKTAGPIKNSAEKSFGGILDNALNGPTARPKEDNGDSAKSTVQTTTKAAPIQSLDQIGNFLAALLVTANRGFTVHDPATLDQLVSDRAGRHSDDARFGPMASDAPKPVKPSLELDRVSNSSNGDTSAKATHRGSDANANHTDNSVTNSVPSFSPKDVFTGVMRNPETGMLAGFYPLGTTRPDAISREYDWSLTDLGWELRPNEYHPSMQA